MNTHICFVLDKSGSMSVIKQETVDGFADYCQSLVDDPNIMSSDKFYLVQFNHEYEVTHDGIPVDNIEELDYKTAGFTALYDAVLASIDMVERKKQAEDRVLFIVMTDGQENSSRKSYKEVVEAITAREKDWTFVFLGANQDAWQSAQALGYSSAGNVRDFDYDQVRATWWSLQQNTRRYAGGQSASVSNFFEEND